MPGKLCEKSPFHGWSETGECRWCEPALAIESDYHHGGCFLPRYLAEKMMAAAPCDGSTEIHAYVSTDLGAFYSDILKGFIDRAAFRRLMGMDPLPASEHEADEDPQ